MASGESCSSVDTGSSPSHPLSISTTSHGSDQDPVNENSDSCKNKAISMARPLDLGIESKVKGKNWAIQFVELSSLLPSKQNERIELVDNGDGVIRCKKANTGSITTIDKWLEAFHVFVAIYTAKFPTEAPSLMKHTNIVQKLAKQAGDEAALFYNEQFRLWREDLPELLPWVLINSELQNEALAMGLSKNLKQNSTGQRKQKPSVKSIVFASTIKMVNAQKAKTVPSLTYVKDVVVPTAGNSAQNPRPITVLVTTHQQTIQTRNELVHLHQRPKHKQEIVTPVKAE